MRRAAIALLLVAALVRAEDGWTKVGPCADGRAIHVSARGDDANSGLSPDQPKQTLAAGYELVREGSGDHLLLKRGESFPGPLPDWRKSGRSAAEPIVIGGYGDGPRPVIELRGTSGFGKTKTRQSVAHVHVIGLDFHDVKRDPAAPDFDPAAGGGQGGYWFVGAGEDLLIEGCAFRFTKITIQRHDGESLRGVRVRRNVVHGAYALEGHVIGFYGSHIDDLLVEENVFDHNGWNEAHPAERKEADVIRSHNLYLSGGHRHVIRGNAFLRAASMGVKLRSDETDGYTDVRVEDNLFVEGEIGLSIGGNTDLPERFRDVVVKENVMVHLGRVRASGRNIAWGMELIDVKKADVSKNLIAHVEHPGSPNDTVGIALVRGPFHNKKNGFTNSQITIAKNVVHDLNGVALEVLPSEKWREIVVSENVFQDPRCSSTPIRWDGPFGAVKLEKNWWWTGGSCLAKVGKESRTADEWFATAGEEGSRFACVPFKDADRTIERYAAELKLEPPTFETLIAEMLAQRQGRWREDCTARAIDAWFREGFRTR